MKNKISIGVLNRNGIKRLKKIIPSLLNQNYSPLEIVIIDNGSTDGSIKFIKKFKKIKLIENRENLGYGKAKNKLVHKCTGTHILMLDNDIELNGKNFISEILRDYDSLKDCAFMSPLVVDINKNQTVLGLNYNKIQNKFKINNIRNKGPVKIGAFRGNTVFFKKEIFIKLKGFDEIYPFNIDDYDLSARAYLGGYSNYVTTNVIATHHGIETRVELNPLVWKMKYYFCGFNRMIIKNYSRKNVLIWLPISSLWITLKVLKISLIKLSVKPLVSHIISIFYFFRDIRNTLVERDKIQKRRKIKDDRFLRVKIPKI